MIQGNLNSNRSPFGGLVPLVMFVGFFILLYFIATGIFKIVSALAIPIAVIALVIAAVIDYTVITDYFKYIINLVKRKPVRGIGLGVLTVFAFPLVFSFLAFKAYMRKKIKKMVGGDGEAVAQKEEFTEYEEVKEDFLELEDIDQPKAHPDPQPQKRGDSSTDDYEDLFK